LDRLAIFLGENTIVHVAYELLVAYLANPDWQKHHVALITLTQITEGRYMEFSTCMVDLQMANLCVIF
jgi:hypothetical protein